MTHSSFFEKLALSVSFLGIALVVGGTKGCQEDYEMGDQASVNATPSATPTETPDPDEVDTTPSPTPTPGEGDEETPEPTATPEATEVSTPRSSGASEGAGFLTELSLLTEPSPTAKKAPQAAQAARSARDSNWLGKAFDGDSDSSGVDRNVDSDGDGYADWLELQEGSSTGDVTSTPRPPVTRLNDRMRSFDPDMDGLTTDEELSKNLDPNNPDTDGDARLDGAEVLSNDDALNPTGQQVDSDNDGLADTFEQSRGSNPTNVDTDSDGLRDDMEFALGTNPLVKDTDGDGIVDGKEYERGIL